MHEPSVSIKYSYFYFSASAFDQLEAKKFKSCAFSVEDGVAPEEALKLYIELNNEPEGELNCPINFNKANSIFTVGCTATIVQQIPRLNTLLKKKREERRIFLKYDKGLNLWYLPLVPGFEFRCRDPQNLKDVKGIYRLSYNLISVNFKLYIIHKYNTFIGHLSFKSLYCNLVSAFESVCNFMCDCDRVYVPSV